MKLISGLSNPLLAQKIAKELNIEHVPTEISTFANGEKRVRIQADLQSETAILLQSLSSPVNDMIIELVLMADAVERLGATKVIAVIPWLGYSLQDKVFRNGEPISAKVIANLVSNSFISQVYLLDLHNSSIPGFFSVPTFHLSFFKVFSQYAQNYLDMKNCLVVSPDFGGLKKAKKFADELKLPLANIDKSRNLSTGEVSINSLQGSGVKGKCALLFDDCIVSGSTAIAAAKLLKEQGASQVYFFATHGLFVNDSVQKIADSKLDHVVISDSIYHSNLAAKITVLTAAPTFATVLKNYQL